MILYYIIVPLAWLVFNIGFRVRCEGRENLKKVGTKGCIIAPNHISAIDPVFIVITRFWGQRMMVFAKKELFEINPFLSWFFRCAGAVCVRGTKEEVGAIDYGMLVHAAMAGFLRAIGTGWPGMPAAEAAWARASEAALDAYRDRPGILAFWTPRLANIGGFVLAEEATLRSQGALQAWVLEGR